MVYGNKKLAIVVILVAPDSLNDNFIRPGRFYQMILNYIRQKGLRKAKVEERRDCVGIAIMPR
ncbi:hypothetical protein U1Q18_048714, partial [Sarracenia purpurea var. burkii]